MLVWLLRFVGMQKEYFFYDDLFFVFVEFCFSVEFYKVAFLEIGEGGVEDD